MAMGACDVADEFFNAVLAGDGDRLREVMTPDGIVWHNFDNEAKPRDVAIGLIEKAAGGISDFSFDDVWVKTTGTGFVRTHIARGRQADGRQLEIYVACVGTVKDGRLSHLYEYFDSAQGPG